MKRLLELLKSERSLVAGAIAGLSDHFGWNRAVARIIGFFVLWGAPYWLGAPTRNAWWISILIYVGLTLIVRKISCSRDRGIARRWRKRFSGGFTVPNNGRQDRGAEPINPPSQEQREPVVSSVPSPASKTSGDDKLVEEPFGEALSDLEQRLTRLDQRIQKMESAVTDRSFDWDRRLRRP
jgi:hypothetical protein